MGQRLVIQFLYKGNPILASYYHWSAYTQSTLDILNQMVVDRGFHKPKSLKEAMLQALQMIEYVVPYDSEGASWNDWGKPQKSFDILKEMFKENDKISESIRTIGERLCRESNRNDGLVDIGKDAETLIDSGEFLTFIDLDEQIIRMEVYSYYDSVREFIEWNNVGVVPFTLVPSDGISLDTFGYDDIPEIMKWVEYIDNKGYCCSTYSGTREQDVILSLIA